MITSCRGIIPAMICILLFGYGCGDADPVEINAQCSRDDDCLSMYICSTEGFCKLPTSGDADGDFDRRSEHDDGVDSADPGMDTSDGDMDMDSDSYQVDYIIEAGDEMEWTDDCPRLPDDYISEDYADHGPLCGQIVCYYTGAPQCWSCAAEPDYSQEGDPCYLAFDIWGRCIDGTCDLRDYPTCSTPGDCEDLAWHKNCHGHWGCVEGLCTQICDD